MISGAFTWETHRRKDGTLDVLSALMERAPPHVRVRNVVRATEFIDEVDELCALRSTEAAAIVLVTALNIVRGD